MKIGAPYTPLPLEGNALFFPSTLGGGNWGGVSVDPALGRLFVNVMHVGQWGHMEKRGSEYVRTSAYGTYARFWNREKRISLPESALWRVDRGRSGYGGHRVAHAAGQDRGAGGDRGARYRVR